MISSVARQTALAMFALRRALKHHQGLPSEEILIPIVRTGTFVDNIEITGLPFLVKSGQKIQVRLVTDTKSFPRNVKVILQPEDAYRLIFTLRTTLAHEVLRAY